MRRLLPLIGTPGSHPGGRSALTCRFRCGDACFHEVPNTSDNAYVGDVIAGAIGRRSMMRLRPSSRSPRPRVRRSSAPASGTRRPLRRWTGVPRPVPDTRSTRPRAGSGSAPSRRTPPTPSPSPVDMARMSSSVGASSSCAALPPSTRSTRPPRPRPASSVTTTTSSLSRCPVSGRQLLVANHEYTDEALMFRGYDPANPTREQVEVARAAHGLFAVAVEEDRRTGRLTAVTRHALNRRVTATTEFRLTGPAAGSDLLKTSADPTGRKVLGTLNNCSGGTTPWAPRCTARRTSTSTSPTRAVPPTSGTGSVRARPSASGAVRQAVRRDAGARNQSHRFGYVVEVHRYHPSSTPRKHTALGRFKHEAATVRLTDDGAARRLHRRRRAFRLLLQVRRQQADAARFLAPRPGAQPLPPRRGDALRARLTGDSPAAEIDGSGKLPRTGSSTAVVSGFRWPPRPPAGPSRTWTG